MSGSDAPYIRRNFVSAPSPLGGTFIGDVNWFIVSSPYAHGAPLVDKTPVEQPREPEKDTSKARVKGVVERLDDNGCSDE